MMGDPPAYNQCQPRRLRERRFMIRQVMTKLFGRTVCAPAPWNTTSFSGRATLGVTSVFFNHICTIPGWFNIDDCAHFTLILSMQKAIGIHGDILEIGSYHGRSTALMATLLRDSENLVVCDAFTQQTDDPYANRPTPETLIVNVMDVAPTLNPRQLVVHDCMSNELDLPAGQRFRFAHADGGHGYDTVRADLEYIAARMVNGGVIAADDYHHADFPDVTPAVDDFIGSHPEYRIMADLNRHGAIGRKIYLVKTTEPTTH